MLTERQLKTSEDRDSLLEKIWNEKRGKEQGINPYVLYVLLDSQDLLLDLVTTDVLGALRRNIHASEAWARRFGKVFVGIDPGGKTGVQLDQAGSDTAKAYVTIDSSKQISPSAIERLSVSGTAGEIIMNEKPLSVEAFLISYIHLLDELVWIKCQELVQKGFDPKDAYERALGEVSQAGFNFSCANEEILLKAAQSKDLAVRLYGSKSHKQVPYVMGGVKAVAPAQMPRVTFLDALNKNRAATGNPVTSELPAKPENLSPGPTGVAVAITFGKPLHIGHTLLIATADLVRRGTDAVGPVYVINNNTGPRPAAALSRFMELSGLSRDEAISMLSSGTVPEDDVITSYRTRLDTQEYPELVDHLDSAGADIFASLSISNQMLLQKAGFDVAVVSEAQTMSMASHLEQIVGNRTRPWAGSGFLPVRIGTKEVSIVQKGGQYTGVGKSVIAHASLMQSQKLSSCVMVDSCAGTRAAATVLDGLIEQAGYSRQAYGAGVNINGRVASGTGGEALTLQEVITRFGMVGRDVSLRDVLAYLVLTMPISCSRSAGLSDSGYDFASNEAFIERLNVASQELQAFVGDVRNVCLNLRGKIGSKIIATDRNVEQNLVYIRSRLTTLQRQPGLDAKTLMSTRKQVSKVEDVTLAFQQAGYAGSELEDMVRLHTKGLRELTLRVNAYLGELKKIMQNADSIIELTPEAYADLEQIIKICMSRIGFERHII